MLVLLSRCSPSKLHSVASVGSTKKWFLPGTNWKESSNISLEKRLRVSKPAIVACASVVSKKPLLGMQYIALCLCVYRVENGYNKNSTGFLATAPGLACATEGTDFDRASAMPENKRLSPQRDCGTMKKFGLCNWKIPPRRH